MERATTNSGAGVSPAPTGSRLSPAFPGRGRRDTCPTLIFTRSAAALLLALATALFVINLSGPPHLVLPRDPISGISLRYLFWLFGATAALLAFLCLFSDRPARIVPWIAWLATNFLIYRIGLNFEGCHDLTGFLATATYALDIPAKAASLLVDAAFTYLFIGSCALLLWRCLSSSTTALLHHSTFPPLHDSNIPFLKTSCFFCKGHIEFPPHAIGQKIRCPHCNRDITLNESV